ncbi:F0F1 ATP synthase subunit delta [Candidatus Saccharibacteria bacterium]|jgi:F0F1-type ATP synthase delta subunit|nr:F0F1 ATP synthase subunit delta [Candidatus Saccharibacteria bacterium]
MELKLPVIINSKQDITYVYRELRSFLDTVEQSAIRGDDPINYPAITSSLRALAQENKLDLRDQNVCKQLLNDLELLKKKALSIHISFPADPSQEVLQKLIIWFRKNVNPQIIIQVGLQPTIAAGVVVRTPNKRFDFSLRQHLYSNRAKLKEALGAD